MKICGIVVLYNPIENIINNIYSYLPIVDEIILFDNSEKEYDKVKEIQKIKQTKYITFNKNMGIAFALKEAMNYAIAKDYDWCLTMDQDSSININNANIEKIKDTLKNNDNYGIISFDYNKNNNNFKDVNIENVRNWITSGNFINVKKYKEIEGFDERLFIDFVDFDIFRQFFEKNIKVGVINYSINHNIGNPIKVNIMGREIMTMNHNPIRYYYRYRNCFYLYIHHKKYYFKKLIYEFTVNLLKMLLFENNRIEKLSMIKKGISDAKIDKLGSIE